MALRWLLAILTVLTVLALYANEQAARAGCRWTGARLANC